MTQKRLKLFSFYNVEGTRIKGIDALCGFIDLFSVVFSILFCLPLLHPIHQHDVTSEHEFPSVEKKADFRVYSQQK